jgi:hypothetical protein
MCAWCGDFLGGIGSDPGVTHGICLRCVPKLTRGDSRSKGEASPWDSTVSGPVPTVAVREFMAATPGCLLDDVLEACPHLTWRDVLNEVVVLERADLLRVQDVGRARYRLWPMLHARNGRELYAGAHKS